MHVWGWFVMAHVCACRLRECCVMMKECEDVEDVEGVRVGCGGMRRV